MRIHGETAYHPPSDTGLLFAPSSPDFADLSSADSVTIDLTELNVVEPETWCSVTAAMEEPRVFELPTIAPAQLSNYGENGLQKTLREGSVGNYGAAPALSPQAAIDFVLEYACHLVICLPLTKLQAGTSLHGAYQTRALASAPLSATGRPSCSRL